MRRGTVRDLARLLVCVAARVGRHSWLKLLPQVLDGLVDGTVLGVHRLRFAREGRGDGLHRPGTHAPGQRENLKLLQELLPQQPCRFGG